MTEADERIRRAREVWECGVHPGEYDEGDLLRAICPAVGDLFAAVDERDRLKESQLLLAESNKMYELTIDAQAARIGADERGKAEMSFADKRFDIIDRLRECADIDEAEGATLEVVAMTREAADTIEGLRARVAELEENRKVVEAGWDESRARAARLYKRVAELERRLVLMGDAAPEPRGCPTPGACSCVKGAEDERDALRERVAELERGK